MTARRIAAAVAAALAAGPVAAQDANWTTFHGNLAAQKFSTASQITPENVDDLEKVWEVETGDVSDGSGALPKTVWSATPIYANGTLYLGTPFYRIFAIAPDTGEVLWTYDTEAELKALTQPALKNRGVTYWEAEDPSGDAPCQKRVYIGTMTGELHSVDADTGTRCTEFGQDGVLDVNQWNVPDADWPLSLLQPPTAYGDQLFIGWAGKDWAAAKTPPGSVFAIDARTGERNWELELLPPDVRQRTGTANVWTAMSVDTERGILYLPVSSPSPNFYGGNRTAEIPRATSVTAVDTESGEVIWSRQLVHHDIWDYDTNAAPTLVDLEREGETVPALVQTTKQGFLYILNRETGEPIFPMEEREVPRSDLKGEEAAPTQPFVPTPAPTNAFRDWPGLWTLADIASFGECGELRKGLRYDGPFTPPAEAPGTLYYPGNSGGMQWGGGAVNPETGLFYVNASRVVQLLTMVPRERYAEIAGGSGAETGYYPQSGTPYGIHLRGFRTSLLGLPCWKPPFGTISAYDLATGERIWHRPFGRVQKWGFYLPKAWGSPTIGGPALTAGGVIFIGASIDDYVRALDPATGEVLWSARMEAPAVANPAVYTHEGREYVVFVAGGNPILKPEVGDQVAAYALPPEGGD